MSCPDCFEQVHHCHDILIVHVDGTYDCVEPKCSDGPEAHEWIYACADLEWTCTCAETPQTQPLAA